VKLRIELPLGTGNAARQRAPENAVAAIKGKTGRGKPFEGAVAKRDPERVADDQRAHAGGAGNGGASHHPKVRAEVEGGGCAG
jgi:hypothetical protein